MNLFTSLTRTEKRYSLDEYASDASQFFYNGLAYQGTPAVQQTYDQNRTSEATEDNFVARIQGIYKRNGVVYACEAARLDLFTEARLMWQQLRAGRPQDMFWTRDLLLAEKPWFNGSTGELLGRMLQDVDFSGNAYIRRTPLSADRQQLERLRPDWTVIVMGTNTDLLSLEVLGYGYQEGGFSSDADPVYLDRSEVAHWSPKPDPLAHFRGMSWLSTVLREVRGDTLTTEHKLKFFEHGATPNMVVRFDPSIDFAKFSKFKDAMEQEHRGVTNAYKCLHPDTEVAMWDGSRRRAEDVRKGEQVVSWSDGRGVPGLVSEVAWQPAAPIVTVTTQRGRVIKTNDRHPFLTSSGWVDANQLKPGARLVTGLDWDNDQADTLTAHEAWVLGVITGDGSTISSTTVVSAWDEGVRARLLIEHVLNHTGAGHDYRIPGVSRLIRAHGLKGKRSWEKRIPEAVMLGSSKVKAAFLSGLIDTDGHVTSPDLRASAEVGITSTSEQLLRDAQHLLAALGVNASVSLSMAAGRGGNAATRAAWRLCAFGNDQARRLHLYLDLACESKRTRLAEYATRPSRQDRSRLDRVASVEIGSPEPTIGIEVAGYHNHVTGGVVTHNTMYLGGGADATVVGLNFEQMDFKATQGAGETRIAAAAGVPPVIVGLSEGLAAATYSNYGQARRRFADMTIRPLWRSACAALETILPPPSAARLWYDDRDIPALQEDEKDAADIQSVKAQTIASLVREGFTPESVVAAVENEDMTLLSHTGLLSVQLNPAGSTPVTDDEEPPALPPAA